jgi:putative DNA primase/helicase
MNKRQESKTVENLEASLKGKFPSTPAKLAKGQAPAGSNGQEPHDPDEDKSAQDAFVQEVMRAHGMPAFENDRGKLSQLNELFWSNLFCRENIARYIPAEAAYYLYNPKSGAFELMTEDALRGKLGARIERAAFTWGSTWFPLQRFCSTKVLNGLIPQVRTVLEARGFFMEPPCRYIHCSNGVVHFGPKGRYKFRGFSPLYRSRYPSPLRYEPKEECPKFRKMLLGHLIEDDQKLLQKAAGQFVMGYNLTQRIFIYDGPGGSSKGAYAALMREVLGRNACGEIRTKLLEERFEIGRLMAKSLALGADVPDNFLNTAGAARLKSFVGGDFLDFEKKNSNANEGGAGIFNVLITANTRLRIRPQGDRSAWKRRLTLIRADKPFEGKKIPDVHLMLLREEGSGILNWIIEGAKLLLKDIEETGDIVLTETQHKRVEDLLDESDSLALFLRSKVRRSEDGDDLTSDEIVSAYAQFCISNQWNMLPISTVNQRLPDLMSQTYGVLKSHSICRDGKDRNGFARVAFCGQEVPKW